jgi:hypothetical protein
MRRAPILTVLLAAAMLPALVSAQPAAPGAMNPPLSPRNANYSIDVRLDPVGRAITASEIVTWRNITTKAVGELQFHLYWNAWQSASTTFMRERALAGAPPNRGSRDWTHVEISSITLVTPRGAVDLTSSRRFIAPDDGNADDATVMAVKLPAVVAPGGEAVVEVKWSAHVPRTFARTGVIGNFFFVAQWFPKLGVLQNDGWNCHQFHASTEFFSDYGVYDVSMTIPQGWTVGATGVERGRRDNADRTTTYRYYQEDVHDFAWTTSPDYIERTAHFAHPTLPAVDIRLLLQPEHAGQAERHFNATRAALKYYGEWFGAYPYGHITVIDPAYQSGAGGMEYPTLFTAGSRWIAPSTVLTPDEVTIHEAGHQWWYGIVGNNETEDAWMDEGFNTFSEARVAGEAYMPNYLAQRYFGSFIPYVFTDIVLDRETIWNRLPGYRRTPKSDAQSEPSFKYFPATGGVITYNKTALAFNTLERWLGWPVLQRILSTHFARWKFRHPTPNDFFNTVAEVAGRDRLEWYLSQVYRSSNVFDYGIQALDSARDGNRYHTNVVVRRYGEAIFPVDVRVTFAGGERVTEHWDGKDRWTAYAYDRESKAMTAAVDPDRVLLLDVNYTNNSMTLAPQGAAAATKWSMTWMVWLQDHLLSWAFFA